MRDQIIEQIGLQIASGALKARDKLPSIRALAQKLGIHHSTVTAAYNHLAEAGLLDVRQGSGVRVAGRLSESVREPTLDTLFQSFLAQAAESGLSRSEVTAKVNALLEAKPVSRILVVDRNADFHPLLLSELQPNFALPIVPITYPELRVKQELLEDSLLVTSIYHLFPLQSLPLNPTRLVVSTVEPGSAEMQAIERLRTGSLVAFVSVSPTLLRMATNMAAALRGEEIPVRCLQLSEATEIAYIMKYAALVVCDRPSESVVRSVSENVPVQTFRLYSQTTVELIRDRLEKWG